MGANNSTRKITLVNDEKAGVIKLSESLAQRLRGQLDSDKGPAADSYQPPPPPPISPYQFPPSPPPTPPPPPPPVEVSPPSSKQCEKQSHMCHRCDEGVETNGDQIPAWSVYAKEAHLMSTRLREEKELELILKDEEWRRKMKEREKEYTNMTNLSESHLKATAKEVDGLFMKVSCSPVCKDQQQNVMKCYQDHPRQSLRCAEEVDSFARCVDLSRLVK